MACLLKKVRIKQSKNLHRVIIQTKYKEEIIVLHGFTKSENMKEKEHKKLLKKELKEAERRYKILINAKNQKHHLK